MNLHCQSGISTTNMVADLPGYPKLVRFSKHGIANTLSLSKASNRYKVTFDSEDNNGFIVHGEHKNDRFIQSKAGLFYLDTLSKQETSLVTTVKISKKCTPTGSTKGQWRPDNYKRPWAILH